MASHAARRSLFSDMFIPASSRNAFHPRQTVPGLNTLPPLSHVGNCIQLHRGPRLGVLPGPLQSKLPPGVPRGPERLCAHADSGETPIAPIRPPGQQKRHACVPGSQAPTGEVRIRGPAFRPLCAGVVSLCKKWRAEWHMNPRLPFQPAEGAARLNT